MGELLRSPDELELIDQLFSNCFDETKQVLLYPVRHHSPVCSFHLKKVVQEFKPEAVLIEGPENASELIPFMSSDQTTAPFCIYLSFDDKDGLVNEEPDQYRAYYPFLDYSPEYTAIREAAKLGAHCEFIDMSYGDILINSRRDEDREQFYRDERAFSLGDFYQHLIEKTGCKSFEELWETLFEIEGKSQETREFVRGLFTYCYYSRSCAEREEKDTDRDLMREQVMKTHLEQAMKQYEKILVVTGGIHTIALAQALYERQNAAEKETNPVDKTAAKKFRRLKPEQSPAYLMPWSYEESDQASGYRSGMIFPYFYQRIWENMEKKKKRPYEETVLQFILRTASEIRRRQALSIADEMQSYYMARGLAGLRGKKECGVFELIDSVKASFVKGEINSIYQPALKQLYRLMTGMNMGQVDSQAGVPPLVNDFLFQCRRFRIQTSTTLKKETRLDIYNKPEHRSKSRFFRQMEFLGTGFCTYLKGQEDNGSTGRILLRESWEYRYHPQVQSALIDVSVYGGTLRQACLTLAAKQMREEHHTSQELSGLLLSAEQMGLWEVYQELSALLLQVIGSDMDFLSVIDCFVCLNQIHGLIDVMGEEERIPISDLEQVMAFSLNRSFTLLYTVLNVKKEDEDPICERIRYLYQYFINHESEQQSLFLDEMATIYQDMEINSAVAGVAAGILLKKEQLELTELLERFEAYVRGTDESKKMAVSFLKGFFMTAKDVIFVDDRLIALMDEILKETTGDLFLELLPDLRLAFTYFLPFETDKIAKRVAELYGVGEVSWLLEQAVGAAEMELAGKVDRFCRLKLDEWFPRQDGGQDGECDNGQRDTE